MSDKPREELEKLAAALDAEKQTLPSFLRHAAKVQPADAIAIQQGFSPARTLTYSQFVALTYTLASKLRSAGVKAGQIVPILTWRKNVELIVAQYAVMLCGAAFAPMDPTFPTGVTKHKIGKAKASIVIALDMEDRKLEELEKEGALHGASSFRLKEGDCHPGGDEGEEKDEAQADETAYVMFTSGSTGNPKGVLQTHRQACASLKGFIPQFSFGPGARVLSTISAAWDISCCDTFGTLSSGGTLCLSDSEDVLKTYADDLDAFKATSTNVPPALVSSIKSDATIARLNVLISGGDKAEAGPFARWAKLGPQVFNGYGLTETGIGNLCYDATTSSLPAEGLTVPIGKPYGSNTVHICKPDSLEEVPAGEEGELVLGGEQIASGYLDEPELTAKKFVKGQDGKRLFRTGDLGRFNKDGDVELSGRADEVIKLTGYRIGPEEVQAPLREVLEGGFCCALALETDTEQHEAKLALAFVPPQSDSTQEPQQVDDAEQIFFSPEEAESHLERWRPKLEAKADEQIAYYARPAAYLPIRFVPLNSNNKQDKKRIREAAIRARDTGTLVFA